MNHSKQSIVRKNCRSMVRILMLLLIFTCLLSGSTSAAKKKKKTRKSRKVVVAVVDLKGASTYGSTMRWAKRCGMVPKLVTSENVNPARYDGLLVPGGGDVDPRTYGAKRSRKTFGTNIKRDRLQIQEQTEQIIM